MVIQHNISAMNSHRTMGVNNSSTAKNLEKLSSGYRINRAGDDAAGLAISEKMRGQIRGLAMAEQNTANGISLIQTAEGGLNETHAILQRMRELAVQSSNGTFDEGVDRAQLDKEFQAIKEEIDRISTSTHYNGIKLLDGSLSGAGKTSGSDLKGAQILNIKGATLEAKATNITAAGWSAAKAATGVYDEKNIINVDGTDITIDWSKLTDEQKTALEIDVTTATQNQFGAAATVIQDTINNAINDYNAANGSSVGTIKVTADQATKKFSFQSTQRDLNSKVEVDFITANGKNSTTAASVLGIFMGGAAAGTGIGAVDTAIQKSPDVATTATTALLKVDVTDLNGKFNMYIGDQKVELDTSGTPITDAQDLLAGLQDAIDNGAKLIDAALGTTGTDKAYEGKLIAEFDKDGRVTIKNTTGENLRFEDIDDGEVAKTYGLSAEAKATNGGGLVFQIGANGGDDQRVRLNVGDMSAKGIGIANLSVKTIEKANAAITSITNATNIVSGTRADLGALQNRLEHTQNNLGVTKENLTAAESTIRDVDMAKEMMDFTKNQILVQASQAMLAQANQLPQGVLQLLR